MFKAHADVTDDPPSSSPTTPLYICTQPDFSLHRPSLHRLIDLSPPAPLDDMVADCCNLELTFGVSVHRMWKAAACEDHVMYPKIVPEYFASVELIGDGEAGSTKIFRFTPAAKPLSFVKDHVEVLDHASHTLRYKTIEGGYVGLTLKSIIFEYRYEALSDDACAVKIKMEYDTLDDKPVGGEEVEKMKEGTARLLKAVEGYLLANPGACA
ncbi:unnamed protein product [Musa hybrid cultivar]